MEFLTAHPLSIILFFPLLGAAILLLIPGRAVKA